MKRFSLIILASLCINLAFAQDKPAYKLYNQKGKDAVVALMKAEVEAGVAATEKAMNAKFGSTGEAFPLLLSVRSGARVSMPGMMDTVLNLGLNDDAVQGIAAGEHHCAGQFGLC